MTHIEPCYILLDVDGVLNPHSRHENGYCGIDHRCVTVFNHILTEVLNAKICIISSWRYDVHAGRMTPKGIEAMLLTHGVSCYDRVVGVTVSDEEIAGHARTWEWLKVNGGHVRRTQVWRWLYGCDMPLGPSVDDRKWCVLDDLDLGFLPEYRRLHVQTDPDVGLTWADADKAIAILRGK